jgi:glycine/D-amino acid oxidase-like deaminating enzyme
MSSQPIVGVLGSGILGSSVALSLARHGARVTLYDQADRPFTAASRWNEGKIHLGCLYAADTTLDTARRLLPGALAFKDLVEDLTGMSLDEVTTPEDDLFLVHHDSIVSPDETRAYLEAVAGLAADLPGADRYLTDLRRARIRPVSREELTGYDPEVVAAAFRVPERSVDTVAVADRFVAALEDASRIEMALRSRVTAVSPGPDGLDGPLEVVTTDGRVERFDFVVNALWEGRPGIDAGLGIAPIARWSHRYRLALFVTTARDVAAPSAILTTGPFGDMKAYGPRRFYLSWYPAGLVAEGTDTDPPPLPELDSARRAEIAAETFGRLGAVIPAVGNIERHAAEVRVAGGWVFAMGRGSLADPAATLHRRDRIGIYRHGRYLSVDTGKYSTAPLMAREVADMILAG